MNFQEIKDELFSASSKFDYLIGLCDESDTNNHRQVILKKYISEIQISISDVTEKITKAYEAINECETSDDSSDDYIGLYAKLANEANKERKFINDFGASMTMWHMLM